MAELHTTVAEIISKELGVQHLSAVRCAAIKPDHLLEADLGVNSIDRVCIAVAIDEHFGIETSDDDVAGWASVSDVTRTVWARVPHPAEAQV